MPELPEVETAHRQLERALRGKRLTQVYVDAKDRIVFDRASPQAVKRALDQAKVTGTGRRGKYFWMELDRRPWVVLHLGMTGNVEIRGARGFGKTWGGVKLWSERGKAIDPNPVPRFCRLLLTADDGTQVAITDPRRFGRIRLAKDPLKEAPLSKLGADPLEDFPKVAELRQLLAKRKAPIKAVLLDQKLFAGVGNWIADEILFQAHISPHRLAKDLDAKDVARLRARTLSIIRKAVSVGADYHRFPSAWLFHDRWGKKKDAYHSRGHEIRHDTIGGRTTAWVPEVQR